MHVLSSVDIETALILLEIYGVLVETSDHHVRAPIEVVHYILQGWLEGLPVDGVKVDVLF